MKFRNISLARPLSSWQAIETVVIPRFSLGMASVNIVQRIQVTDYLGLPCSSLRHAAFH
jgi:hypothetical protein